MSGIINAATPAGDDGAPTPSGMGTITDPVLMAAEQQLEKQLDADPQNKQNYLKIVVAGMHAALARGPDGILASLKKSPDPVRDAAQGAVALVLILRHESKGIMPVQAMIPAAMTLMLRALDFVNRTGLAQVGVNELKRATHIFANEIFRKFSITAPMLAHATAKVQQITRDPVAMAQVNLKAGITQHPQASNPTPLPPG